MSLSTDAIQLTVTMIVRDCAEGLRKSLASIHEIAHEIVIVDTGSQDETIQVAESFGARVFECKWQDDFSKARNACLAVAESAWVLWLDAGETISAEQAKQLKTHLQNHPSAETAYQMLVELPANGPNAAAERVARIRLVPNRSGIRFTGRVRESLAASLSAQQMKVDLLPITIRRSSSEHNVEVKKANARRNIRLADAQIKETSPTADLLNCLGDAFQTLEDNDRAVQFFRHALQASETGSVEMLEAYYGIITSLEGDGSQREEQLATCVQAVEVFPLDAQLLCAMGGYLQAQGQTEIAMKAYHTAYRHGQVNPAVWHVGNVREIAAICYSLTLQMLQRDEQAQQLLEEAVASDPDAVRLRRHLLELHIKRGQRDEALQQVGQFPVDFPNREALRSAVRGACLAAADNWLAAKAYLNTAYNAGSRDPICLRWFATTLISLGEVAEARPVVENWVELEPSNATAHQFLTALKEAEEAKPEEKKPENEEKAPAKQLRIDEPNSGQSPSPTRSPAKSTAPDSPISHRR